VKRSQKCSSGSIGLESCICVFPPPASESSGCVRQRAFGVSVHCYSGPEGKMKCGLRVTLENPKMCSDNGCRIVIPRYQSSKRS
jgi:hypothetical protein